MNDMCLDFWRTKKVNVHDQIFMKVRTHNFRTEMESIDETDPSILFENMKVQKSGLKSKESIVPNKKEEK